jgi:hypothetical protein
VTLQRWKYKSDATKMIELFSFPNKTFQVNVSMFEMGLSVGFDAAVTDFAF